MKQVFNFLFPVLKILSPHHYLYLYPTPLSTTIYSIPAQVYTHQIDDLFRAGLSLSGDTVNSTISCKGEFEVALNSRSI